MAENIKAKIELITSSAGIGGGQAPIGGSSGFKKALSVEKFKAAKAITAGTLGQILAGGIVAAVGSLLGGEDVGIGDGGGEGAGVGGPGENEAIEKAKEETNALIEAANKYGLGLITLEDGTQSLIDSAGNLIKLTDIQTMEKQKKTAEFVLKVNEMLPKPPKFINDFVGGINSLISKIKGALGFDGGSVSTPAPITSGGGSNSPIPNSTPANANFNHMKYGAIYKSPFVSGGNYPIIDLDRTNDLLNQDLINSWGQD
ncbi:hypothetical protein CL614_03655 [archaeon]|jgi:hypothetical protein|nr:hypothetical protein [archaeon]|tara:strand:+ start:3568 stop:4341 length:774 start_codon:yes stop_codon:yes gene_type:complete